MTVHLDPLLVRALAAELEVRLEGTRVRAVRFDYPHREVRLFTDAGTVGVQIGLGKTPIRMFLTGPAEPGEDARRLPARIVGVASVPDERILVFEMRRIRGRSGRYALVVEFRPGDANVALVESETDTVRHLLLRRESRGRRWRTGHPYPFPESSRAGTNGSLSGEEWAARFSEDEHGDARRELLRGIAFTSPINAEWILEPTGARERRARWTELVDGASATPVRRSDGQPYPHALGDPGATEVPSLFEAVFEVSADDEVDDALPRALVGRLERLVSRARKRHETLTAQLDTAPESDHLRANGDLLLARLHDVPRGVDSVTLEGFDGEPVTIALDPALDPRENAVAWYAKATRASRARERLPGLVAEAEEDVARWNALHERVRAGAIDADELEAALPAAETRGPRPDGPSLPYRPFRSSGGLEIRLGKGAKKNDDLTFRHARPDDVWLHARHSAGAHVVLRWTRPEAPPARDLEEAAILAAVHSKARTSGSVPVDWTRRKYVRKPKGAKAGLVTIERQQTVFVEPDPGLVDRLAVDEDV